MRTFIALFILTMTFNIQAQTPLVVEAPLDYIFIPNGFDNNDNVEVVITGKFPSPCYTRNKVTVDVKDSTVRILITSLARQNLSSSFCEPLAVPFKEIVTVGNLQGGKYQVVVNEGGKHQLNGELTVDVSNSEAVDDHLYANVEYIDTGFTGGLSGDALLVGTAASSCLELDRVEYLTNNKDTLSVLPIMKKISSYCPEKSHRLEVPIKFDPSAFSHRKVLLFVRSIDGKSIINLVRKDE
jgi:hypothetical protein